MGDKKVSTAMSAEQKMLQDMLQQYSSNNTDPTRTKSMLHNNTQLAEDHIQPLLMCACERGYDQLISDLRNIDVIHERNSVTEEFVTHKIYLYLASREGHVSCVQQILQAVNSSTHQGEDREHKAHSSSTSPYSLHVHTSEVETQVEMVGKYVDWKLQYGLLDTAERRQHRKGKYLQAEQLRLEITANACNCVRAAVERDCAGVVDLLLEEDLHQVQEAIKLPLCQHHNKTDVNMKKSIPTISLMITQMPAQTRRLFDRKLVEEVRARKLGGDEGGGEMQYEYDLSLLDMTARSLPCCCSSKETTRKDDHPVIQIYNSASEELYTHNYVSAYLYLNWKRVRFYHFSALLWYALYMTAITMYMLNANRYKLGDEINDQETVTPTNIPDDDYASSLMEALAYVVAAMSLFGICIEILQMLLLREVYIENYRQLLENALDWYMYSCSVYVVLFPVTGYRESYQWELGATCILASWFAFLFHHPIFSTHLYLIVEVIVELWRFTLMFVLFLLMFGLTFSALLNNQEPYNSVPSSLMRTWTMMLGDIGYEGLFFPEEPHLEVQYRSATYVLFFLFLLLGVVITNMWTGFIISRLESLEKQMSLQKKKAQMDFILTMQMMIPSCLRGMLCSCCTTSNTYTTKNEDIIQKTLRTVRIILGDMTFKLPDLHRLQKTSPKSHHTTDARIQALSNRVDDLHKKLDELLSAVRSPNHRGEGHTGVKRIADNNDGSQHTDSVLLLSQRL